MYMCVGLRSFTEMIGGKVVGRASATHERSHAAVTMANSEKDVAKGEPAQLSAQPSGITGEFTGEFTGPAHCGGTLYYYIPTLLLLPKFNLYCS